LSAVHARAVTSSVRLNALALVLRDDQLYAARAGTAFAALSQPGELRFLPADRRDPLESSLPPLGAAAEPDMQLSRYTVTPGEMLLAADEGLFNTADDAIGAALSSGDLDAAIEQLKALSEASLSASVMRFAPATESGAGHLKPRVSQRTPQARPDVIAPQPAPVERATPREPVQPA